MLGIDRRSITIVKKMNDPAATMNVARMAKPGLRFKMPDTFLMLALLQRGLEIRNRLGAVQIL